MQTTFSLAADDPIPTHHGRKSHRRGNSKSSIGSGEKDDVSLTYSASSSVQSGSSTTGESTDSSFADIYKVLDRHEEEALIGALGSSIGDLDSIHNKSAQQTVTGQPTDSSHDGGMGSAVFRAANGSGSAMKGIPLTKNGTNRSNSSHGKSHKNRRKNSGGNNSVDTRSTAHSSSTNGTANNSSNSGFTNNSPNGANTPIPRGPVKKTNGKQIWYSQLWMCGFADALNFSSDS
jgi:hypothetical protein